MACRFESNQDFCGGDRKAFADSHIERHPVPSVVINVKTDGGECLDFRIRIDSRLLSIAAKLAANNVGRFECPHVLEQSSPLIASRFAVAAYRTFFGKTRDDL